METPRAAGAKQRTELPAREQQVRSKQRIVDHGEVFTNSREVNAMLDLVKDEAERIDSRFLEPACGNGNFLAAVATRKLASVAGMYRKDQTLYEKNMLIAAGSIYGIDILMDNVEECIDRLYQQISKEYTDLYRKRASEDVKKSLYYIISRNIVCGDALKMEDESGKPIVFPEWTNPTGNMIKRRDYVFCMLMRRDVPDQSQEGELFGAHEEGDAFIPRPVREYAVVNYRRLWECDDRPGEQA